MRTPIEETHRLSIFRIGKFSGSADMVFCGTNIAIIETSLIINFTILFTIFIFYTFLTAVKTVFRDDPAVCVHGGADPDADAAAFAVLPVPDRIGMYRGRVHGTVRAVRHKKIEKGSLWERELPRISGCGIASLSE